MDRTELTIAIAGALGLAVLLGAILAVVAGRLNARAPRDATAAQDMAARVRAAETARRAAEDRLAEVEADLGARLAETETELAAVVARLAREQAQTDEIRAAYRATRRESDA